MFLLYTHPSFFGYRLFFSRFLGEGFFPLRLVSFLASLGSFFMIYAMVSRDTGRRFYGFLSACLFAATFKIGGAALDVGGVDALALFFILVAVYVLRFARSQVSHALAGLLFVCAYFTKQVALVPFLAMAIYCVCVRPRKAIAFIGTAVGAWILATIVMNRATEGWFFYHAFELPWHFSKLVVEDRIVRFWTEDLWKFLFVPCILSLVYLFFPKSIEGQKRLFYGFLLLGMLVGSYLSRYHRGGSPNTLLPIYASLSILFGLGLGGIPRYLSPGNPAQGAAHRAILYSVSLVAFLALVYHPLRQIPGEAERAMGRKIMAVLGSVEGEVYAPRYGYLPRLIGKKTYAHRGPFADLIEADRAMGRVFREDVYQAIGERRFDAILCQADLFQDEILKYYRPVEEIPLLRTKFWWPNSDPVVLYLPRDA